METYRKQNRGFTLLETLITLAITVILLAFSAVGVARFREKLRITELDNAARAIYMAAENRAVLLHNSRRLDTELTGTFAAPLSLPDETKDITDGTSYVLWEGTDSGRWGELLPAGTIDPALWEGRFYIVYEKSSGSVTDVFYSEENISGITIADAFKLAKLGRDARMRPRDAGLSCPMLGWFGGGAAAETTAPLKDMATPKAEVAIVNGEELTVKVTFTLPDPDTLPDEVSLTGAIDKVTLERVPSVTLTYDGETVDLLMCPNLPTRSGNITMGLDRTATYTWVLDSLEKKDTGFKYRFQDLVPGKKPGADFTVTARLTLKVPGYNDAVHEADDTNNSLFAEGSTYGAGGTAKIANLRHLQNLHPDHSRVGNGVVKAVQTANIDCAASKKNDGAVLDSAYKFTPITNASLTSYDGQQKELRNLLVAETSGNTAGLFGKITTASTVQKVRLVDAAVSTSGAAAGALAGEVSGNCTFDDCRVYWSDSTKLVTASPKAISYKVGGANTGGLVGAVTGGNVTIKNSFAATTVSGSGHTGGLVGARTGGTLNINNSYADCYLKGGTGTNTGTGGLVGSGTVNNLADCYAAGFITGGAKTAGLVYSNMTNAARTYSAVRVMAADGKTLTEPNTPLYTGPVSGTVKYLAARGSVTADVKTALGTQFEYVGAANSPTTTSYNLRNKVYSAPLLPVRYVFPGVKDTNGTLLPHYGDWGEILRFTAGLVYYEQYSSNAYKMEGQLALESGDLSGVASLDNSASAVVKLDGYALAFEKADALAEKYEVKYGASGTRTWTLEKSGSAWQWKSGSTTQSVSALTIDGKTVIPLPEAEVAKNNLPVTGSFYQQLTVTPQLASGTVGTVIPKTYYFNPHFARSVKTAATANPTTEDAAAIVRTPRHLYDLSNFQNLYATTGYRYKQELNLDYSKYTGYSNLCKAASAADPYRQDPIGKTDTAAFTGTYDGGGKTISSVLCNYNASTERGGLFGTSKGTLKKIVYDMGGSKRTVTARESAYFGGLLGCNYSATVQECTVKGANMTTDVQKISIGGLIGYSGGGTIQSCKSEGVVLESSGGSTNVGGLVGWSGGSILEDSSAKVTTLTNNGTSAKVGGLAGDSEAAARCTAEIATLNNMGESANVGGLVGNSTSSAGTAGIRDCTVNIITCLENGKDERFGSYAYKTNIGGLVGHITNNSISNCKVNAGTARLVCWKSIDSQLGGLVGWAEGAAVTDCVVEINTLYYAGLRAYYDDNYQIGGGGGLMGSVEDTKVENCHAGVTTLTIMVTGGRRSVGGLIGIAKDSSVSNCSAEADMKEDFESSSSTYANYGGLVGYSDVCKIENSFAVGKVSIMGSKKKGSVAGLVRYVVNGSNITNCYACVAVGKVPDGNTIDGIYFGGSAVSNCYYLSGTWKYGGESCSLGNATVPARAGVSAKNYAGLAAMATLGGMRRPTNSSYPFPVGTKKDGAFWYYGSKTITSG